MDKYSETNRTLWDARTEIHVKSSFYDMEAFKRSRNSLMTIEKPILSELSGEKVLHLQCHFGQDTLSIAQYGAEVTGVDFSQKAVNTARSLSEELQIPSTFVESDIYQLQDHLTGQFDFIFTSYGVLCWLADLKKWGEIVDHFLKPGGTFYIVEFHPVMYMLDFDQRNLAYDYFNTGAFEDLEEKTYVDGGEHGPMKSYFWQHSMAEIWNALNNQNLVLERFEEYDYSPYNCFPQMKEIGRRRYQLDLPLQLPHLFEMVWKKN